jgi:DNA-binding LacI/PurR family transcriptional regulator
MKRKKADSTIRDVAKKAGVSIATVSRVINHPELITDETRARVMAAIDECNYIPVSLSSESGLSHTKTIAFFTNDISNRFYIALTKELLRICYSNNYNIIICETESDIDLERKHYRYCKSADVDGIIYLAGSNRNVFETDDSFNIPIVFIDHAPLKNKPSYSIISDSDKAIQLLINYLCNLGHKKIAFINSVQNSSIEKRFNAYLKYIKQNDLVLDQNYIFRCDTISEAAGIDAFDHYYSLPDPPTAVIAAADQIAHGFIMRAMSLGVRIPEDFSVCGMDAIDSSFFYPTVTSARQNIQLIAQKAFNYIADASPKTETLCETIDVSLRVGQTCRKI